MGFRTIAHNPIALQSADAANIYSSAIDAGSAEALSLGCYSSGGTTTGTVTLQFADMETTPAETDWIDLPSVSVSVTGPGAFALPTLSVAYRWMRVVWTKTGGAGSDLAVTMYRRGRT